MPETLEAIKRADLITIGPGSLYTSIIPNLLVDGFVDALMASNAVTVYVCNVMTQPGETEHFSLEDHLQVLLEYSPSLLVDYVLFNTSPISRAAQAKYRAEGAEPVRLSSGAISGDRSELFLDSPKGVPVPFRVVGADLASEDDVVRHDPQKLARTLLSIVRPPARRIPESTTSPRVCRFT